VYMIVGNNLSEKKEAIVEPIAIVGMSCRFPFAHTLQEFWNLLNQGKDTVTEIPTERWNADDYFDPDPQANGKTNQRHASLLKNIHDFDPLFFNISPAEATEMNPSQKLMLELVWEAIENSTIPYNTVQGRKIGVYVGNIWNDFEHHRKHKNANVTSHSAVGQSSNIIANRVSFTYGFTGPSLVVDTGCSSSLVALHLACQSLWDNSTEMSCVAGINHILDPDQYVLLSKFGGLSSNGKCSTFDVNGDGFVRGEGAGVLLLKKLSEAEKDGDKIYAIIRGTAMNNNGYNANLPATSVTGQKQVLHEAYALSGILPSEVHYIEAHGTGTKLGDPTEAKALGEFFREGRMQDLHIGSVKTNIGHLEAAAGIAGLIKVVLAIQHKQLPPSLNYKTPNPNIPFKELKLSVQHELGPWPVQNGETLKAGINSFGWGGTNAHTILEEYRPAKNTRNEIIEVSRYCLPISAKSATALKDYAKAYKNILENASEDLFRKICVSSALLKPGLDHRILFTATKKEEILAALENFIQDTDEITPHKPLSSQDKIVMVFPGQGSQWLGMGRELFKQESTFRQSILDCDQVFKIHTDWSLIDQLFAKPEESRLNEIDVIQPTLCAVQISLAKLWISWGITPDVVVGHSMGEIAAVYIAGTLTLDDAARIICTRSRLMKRVSGTGGAMAVTELSLPQAEELVLRYPQLSVAVNNSPKSTVLAGNQMAIAEVLTELENKGLFGRLVKVDVASHSQQMDPLKSDLQSALQDLTPTASTTPMYSTVRNKIMEGEEMNANYWVDNLRQTVQFASVMENLMDQGHTIFIEVSPHPVLINAINECAEHTKINAITIASLFREKPEHESIFKNLGELFTKGYPINWATYYTTHHAPDVQLPGYPFQRERYELEDKSAEQHHKKNNGKLPLLGNAIQLAGNNKTYFWETQISLGSFPYLQDHQVNETPVLPGAAYVEMMLEAASELYENGIPVVTRLRFIKSINLSHEEISTIQLKLNEQQPISIFQFFVKIENEGKISWELLAECELKVRPNHHKNLAALQHDVPILTTTLGTTYYDSLKSLGLNYGPYFQGLKELKKVKQFSEDEIRFTLAADERIVRSSANYKVHPALLDACFQPLFFTVLEGAKSPDNRTTFLTEVGEVQWLNKIDYTNELVGVAKLYPLKKDEHRGFINVEADIVIYNNDGSAALKVVGLKGKIIDTAIIEQQKENLKNWLYKINWVKRKNITENSQETILTANRGAWVVMGDPYGVSDIVIEKMRTKGLDYIHVIPGTVFSKLNHSFYTINYGCQSDYANLMQDLFANADRKIAGMIHMGSMSYTWQDPYLTADIVEEHQVYGSISFMYLHQQLAALKLSEHPQLIIVTNGIQTASYEADVAQPVHSPLWGMTKVMFNELVQYKCRYFDLSANPSLEELEQIVSQLPITNTIENEIAFRGNEQYVPRLGVYEHEETNMNQRKGFNPKGTYLVTGFRGLGFIFIEWMIRQGARNFALISRSGKASSDVMERITVLESQGCHFTIFKADAGNYYELKNVLEEIESSMPTLLGVIHAAGVIEARTLGDLDQTELLRILNPKVKGAWNLHLLTQHKQLDCFIMFSSASTLIGLSGQGSYVAANAFLDTLAHSRRRMGLPGMSINWGVMNDVGMVANKAELERYARAEGFEPVNMKDAVEVFHAIYEYEHTQIGIVKIHAETMAGYYSMLSQTPYFNGLLLKESKAHVKENSVLDNLLVAQTSEERIALLEQLIIQNVAKIVKTSTTRVKPSMTFKSLGIDSLMAIQLRNLLEKSVNLKLSVSMFWAHPSIHEYTEFLSNALAEQLLIKTIERQSSSTEAPNPLHWFVISKPKPKATFRVFCFHDAGGNASLYETWAGAFSEHIELISVELPGRGRRTGEKAYSDIHHLILDLKPVLVPMLNKPFAFFGHSMGGLVAFEIARELRKSNLNVPTTLFFSSTPGLTTYSRRDVDHTLSDQELVTIFPHLDKKNIGDDEMQQLLLNLLRTDLCLLNNYRYVKEEPLDIPVVVIHGSDDPKVKREQAEKWSEDTSSSCKVITRPGDHRYIDHDGEFLTNLIEMEISNLTTILKSA
jgi:acyl transferase domain-containing protein/surfactin synthase thioesterase subunit/acyl carrier protein